MSATVTQRSRRTNAGKRMTALTGEALEQDEAFWGHETWAEDDSGNESFHSSDEDSENKRDVFDSDFDDSESDHEEEEEEAGQDNERELSRQERIDRSAVNRSYVDVSKIGRGMTPLRRGKGTKRGNKRIMGDGLNAGIVLNIPVSNQNEAVSSPLPMIPLHSTGSAAATATVTSSDKVVNKSRITAASTRPTRTTILIGRQINDHKKKSNRDTGIYSGSVPFKKKRKRYTQEELLLEAANQTEPDNERWLLARKRMQAESEKDKETFKREIRGKIIEKFNSRRGYLNTITFPDMDHVPCTLSRCKEYPKPSAPLLCVITGKPARYRDPKTNLVYYDAAAYKELRRRHEAKDTLTRLGTSASTQFARSILTKPDEACTDNATALQLLTPNVSPLVQSALIFSSHAVTTSTEQLESHFIATGKKSTNGKLLLANSGYNHKAPLSKLKAVPMMAEGCAVTSQPISTSSNALELTTASPVEGLVKSNLFTTAADGNSLEAEVHQAYLGKLQSNVEAPDESRVAHNAARRLIIPEMTSTTFEMSRQEEKEVNSSTSNQRYMDEIPSNKLVSVLKTTSSPTAISQSSLDMTLSTISGVASSHPYKTENGGRNQNADGSYTHRLDDASAGTKQKYLLQVEQGILHS